MTGYPMARWWVGDASVGASAWTRKIPEGGGGGYYLYTWKRGTDRITLKELVEGTTSRERRLGKRSTYVTLGNLEVPGSVVALEGREQEIAVARLIHADLRERFAPVVEWIPYGSDGRPVWFHEAVTGRS